MNAATVAAIRSAAERELARKSLLAFAERMMPEFQTPPHIVKMAELLEEVERENIRRLLINLPARHGKSLLLQLFAAWYLGRHPQQNVMMVTHGAELSDKNSRAARAFVGDVEKWPFDARLSTDSTAVHRWNLQQGGGLYAAGSEGSVTGRGSSLFIGDDMNHDAVSELEQENVFQTFSNYIVPRMDPPRLMVIIGTRFGERDIFGRILESQYGHRWTVLRLPAFAEADDALGRAPGDALWPEVVSAADLRDTREMMGPRAFEAQYMQSPIVASGDLVKAEWLEHRYARVPADLTVIMALDAAAKTGIANDFSAIVTLGYSKTEFFVLDVVRRKVDFADLRKMVVAAAEKHHPKTIYIEDTSNAVGLIQELKKDSSLPVVGVSAKGSKVSRMEAQTGLLESGRVKLPADSLGATWMTDFMRELLALPSGKHDDMADALFLALAQARRAGSSTWSFSSISTQRHSPSSDRERFYR